jgi:hypothetical protein
MDRETKVIILGLVLTVVIFALAVYLRLKS